MTRIIALANQKGGVGKTTTTLNLGAALAERGRRVLLIDLDPQSNLTVYAGLSYNQRMTSYQILKKPEHGVSDAIQPVRTNLEIIPSTLDMAAAELELAGTIGREALLRKALLPSRAHYDYILIDPPPSLGVFTLNALVAATDVIIPQQVEYFAVQGTSQLRRTIQLVREDRNPGLHISGVLCTMTDSRKTVSTSIENEIRRLFGDAVFQTTIPDNTALSKSTIARQPIIEYEPGSAGAAAYRALAEEVDDGSSEKA
jgi:chromosome partitioning protein